MTKRLDLNAATLEELTQLPSVGKPLARRIIAARPFKTVRDLILIDGVGPRLYVGLLPLITVLTRSPRPARKRQVTRATPAFEIVAPLSIVEPVSLELEPVGPTPIADLTSAPEPEAAFSTVPQPEPKLEEPTPVVELEPEPVASASAFELASVSEPEPASEPELIEPAPVVEPEPEPERVEPVPVAEILFAPQPELVEADTLPEPQPKIVEPALTWTPPQPRRPVAPPPSTSKSAASYVSSVERSNRFGQVLLFGGIGVSVLLFLIAIGFVFTRLADVSSQAALAFTSTVEATRTPVPPTESAVSPTTTAVAAVVSTAVALPQVASTTSVPAETATVAPSSTPTLAPPTDTPAPTTTPQPTAPIGAGALAFSESFDPPGYYWGVGNTSFSRSEFRDGQLNIHVNRGAISYVFGGMEAAQDFYYQAMVTAGVCGEGDHFGLQVRAQSDATFYLFGITCDGKARAQSIVDGKYTVLFSSSGSSPAVKTGEGAANALAVRVVGANAEFFVNGERVASLSGLTAQAGRFGLYAKSVSTGVLTISFDDVSSWNAP